MAHHVTPRHAPDQDRAAQASAAVGSIARASRSELRLPSGTLAYTTAGSGPPLLLVHGLGGTRATWQYVIEELASTHTVLAPDLPGHGESQAPAGDYSLGAHATVLRDFLLALGYQSASVMGHSLGGGVALQFAYQFPERIQRLVLISSGGLGPELSLILRAATLPGADPVVAALACIPQSLTRTALQALSLVPGVAARQDAAPLAEGLRGLSRTRRRRAFIRTARTVIDWRGQLVSALAHLDLLAELPVLLAWGSHDRTIPPHHHLAVARRLRHAQAVELTAAGHYPQETAADRLVPHVQAFLESTPPFTYDEQRWAQVLNSPVPQEPTPMAVVVTVA